MSTPARERVQACSLSLSLTGKEDVCGHGQKVISLPGAGVLYGEREGNREGERENESGRERNREGERETGRERERQKQGGRERERDREREKQGE